jgi:UDP-sulfoquinovose synthase
MVLPVVHVTQKLTSQYFANGVRKVVIKEVKLYLSKVLVTGWSGYLGWPTTIRLLKLGHEVMGIDNNLRENLVSMSSSESATPIDDEKTRKKFANKLGKFEYRRVEMTNYYDLHQTIESFEPDYIIHLAAQPSAPYSMINNFSAYSVTQENNNRSTINLLWIMKGMKKKPVLIFASTMGVYGQPEYSIPFDGMMANNGKLEYPIPYMAGSFYHISKTVDEQNIIFATKQWGLKSVIFRQGVVFGLWTNDTELMESMTRFDFDTYFGTALNRFVAQAVIGQKMTLYGKGKQTRGFVTLEHCIQDLVSIIDRNNMQNLNPNQPEEGKPMIRNSVTDCFGLDKLVEAVMKVIPEAEFTHIENPRKEKEENDLVMEESPRPLDLQKEISYLYSALVPFREKIRKYYR